LITRIKGKCEDVILPEKLKEFKLFCSNENNEMTQTTQSLETVDYEDQTTNSSIIVQDVCVEKKKFLWKYEFDNQGLNTPEFDGFSGGYFTDFHDSREGIFPRRCSLYAVERSLIERRIRL
jgi:hypothetical protein